LGTGCPATSAGLKAALAKAQKLESDLILERFTWTNWGAPTEEEDPQPAPTLPTLGEAIEKHETEYWQINRKTPGREKYYLDQYAKPFEILPLDERPSAAVLRDYLLRSSAPDTRHRQKIYMAYTALARFVGLELPKDWSKLRGKYKPSAEREIPTDDQILEAWSTIPSDRWRWAYGMMAAYGLRNHEIVRVTLEFPRVRVWDDSKTGSRVVYPLHPDWPERFNLAEVNPPQLTSAINKTNGGVVTRTFSKLKLGFTAYALRDAYAIRGAIRGISPAIVAKWMGHSLNTHYGHYLKYLDQSDFDQVWGDLSPML
jgi:hypothetical protein